jgi:hypothetical protein
VEFGAAKASFVDKKMRSKKILAACGGGGVMPLKLAADSMRGGGQLQVAEVVHGAIR